MDVSQCGHLYILNLIIQYEVHKDGYHRATGYEERIQKDKAKKNRFFLFLLGQLEGLYCAFQEIGKKRSSNLPRPQRI